MTLRPLFLIAATCVVLVLAGCSTDTGAAQEYSTLASPSSNGTYPMKVLFCGQEVTVKHEPQRVIDAGREGVVNIVSVGTADRTMARFGEHGAQCGLHIENELSKLTGIEEVVLAGGKKHGSTSFERILELRPDMIYGSALGDGDLSIDNFETNGTSAVMPPSSYAHAFADVTGNFADLDVTPVHVREFGVLLNTTGKADTNASIMETDLAEAQTEGKKPPELMVAGLYYWDPSEDLFTYGADSTIQGIFGTAHPKNVVVPTYDAMFNGVTSPEAIVKLNPDVLIMTTGEGGVTLEDSLARLEKVSGMTETAAFKNKRTTELPSGAAYPTVEAIDAAREPVETLAE